MAGGQHWVRMTPQQRFDAQYMPEPMSGCWLWIGSVSDRGYGKIYANGKHLSAHRFSWMLHFNEDPHELLVCHKCDNPQCVNPDHLFLGTVQDNAWDKMQKGRHDGYFVDKRGSRHPGAKLTEDQAREAKFSQRPVCELALEFNVHRATIASIRAGDNWKHLTEKSA